MTSASSYRWEAMRTDETREVEQVLRLAGFQTVDAYRYNPASIRLRVIDPRFEGLSIEARDSLVEPWLERLPEQTQADIMTLLTFAPSELEQPPRKFKYFSLNAEFDEPSPSIL